MIFLMGPEPWSNPVFSWFRKEVLQERSRFRNVLKKIFLHISSLRLVAFRSVHPFLQGSPFCPPPNPMLCNVLVDWTLLGSASSTILATRCTICTRFLGHTQVHIPNRFSCGPAVVVGSTPTNVHIDNGTCNVGSNQPHSHSVSKNVRRYSFNNSAKNQPIGIVLVHTVHVWYACDAI